METITINVADYYGNPSYYSVMPEAIFDALELASLKGEPTTTVDKALFEKMIIDYKQKNDGMGKRVKNYWIALALIFLQLLCGCSSSDNEGQPTPAHDITGVWLEYAYLCSDGYFVDISNTGYNMYYEFLQPNIFNQYEIVDGDKDYRKQGTWTFDNISNVAKVIEPRGWNLDIRFEFISDNDATLHITGRTTTSNMTIKARRINK